MLERQLLGLAIGFIIMLTLILRSKLSAFPSLIIGALTTGIIAGLPALKVAEEIAKGFGNTMMNIGIVIGLGIMLGKILEVSGAAKTMAITLLRLLGKGKEEWAMAGTGYLISIPIFSDSGFIILYELAKAISYYTKKSVVGITYALAIGLTATHNMVPPTPGPLAVASEFKVDLGIMIFYGCIVALPMAVAGVLLAGWVGRRVYQVPDENGNWVRDRSLMGKSLPSDAMKEQAKGLPSAWRSFLPLLLPIILILSQTVTKAVIGGTNTNSFVARVMLLLGTPYVAILVSLIVGLFLLAADKSRVEVSKMLGDAMNSAGMIVFVTAGGGALGNVIRVSGIGEALGQVMLNSNIPILLLPFLIATLIKIAQGSSTVAVITSAAITAPLFSHLNMNPVLPALSACAAGGTLSHLNDSFFWLFAKMNGLTETETLWTYSFPKCVEGVVGIITVFILSMFI